MVGAGTFGLAATLELRRRGWEVLLLDQGEIPHPLAASTDISKVCRMEYGPDEDYMAWMEKARHGWLEWNRRRRAAGKDPLYHETGVLMMCLDPMQPGAFEAESYRLLRQRRHRPERIGGTALVERFPAWSPHFVDGFYHPAGGFAESGRVIRALAREALEQGVAVRPGTPIERLAVAGGRVTGVATSGGVHGCDQVVLATGSWTGRILPELEGQLQRSYHPVWHLAPEPAENFTAERFPTFTADVARTGFYGFPLHPAEKVVKIGHHGLGLSPPPGGDLTVPEPKTRKLRAFLGKHFPQLAAAPVVATRLCPYCDTADEDFWIANDPERRGLTVASGGSGHGFKFVPVLGPMIADTVEGKEHRLSHKFRWRPEIRLERGREAARCHDDVL